MLGTYVSLAIILTASALVGQAFLSLCGRREWTPLSPAVGLGLMCALIWGASHLASSSIAGLVALGVVTLASAVYIRRDPPEEPEASVWPVVVGAVVLASFPFLAELRFGILGTSLNPDMSQHLFAADRIASGGAERLVDTGYPLGPHALVASVAELGPSLVHGFGGLTIAVAACASLAPLAILTDLSARRRATAALLTGFAYLASSYLIQGAFKETMEAMFLLAFAIGLVQLARGELGGLAPEPRWERLGGLTFAALAIGAIYSYSFPGLTWLVGALGVWIVFEAVRARGLGWLREGLAPTLIALGFTAAVAAPEIPRMLDFANFETFDPDGAGLGNLFNPISPLESLGIWPSGDFRLDPGAGFAPAITFYLGGALAALALAAGVRRCIRQGETGMLAAGVAGTVLYIYALVAGTPYQEAKALAIVAPVLALIAIAALMYELPVIHTLRSAGARAVLVPVLGILFVAGAAGSTALALVNGPVGPSSWSPILTEFNAELDAEEVTLAVVDEQLLDQNGFDLVAWELRGRELCVLGADEVSEASVGGQAFEAVVVIGELDSPLPVVGRLDEADRDGDYVLYRSELSGEAPECPFIADGDRAGPGE